MEARRSFLGPFAAAALGFLYLACSSSTAENCPVGAESCPCTSGNACDPGLMCLSTRCVRTTSTGTAGFDASSLGTTSTGAAGASGVTTGAVSDGGTTTSTTGGGRGGSTGIGGATGSTDAAIDSGSGGAAGKAGTGGTMDAGNTGGTTTLGGACKATGNCMSGLICLRASDDISAVVPGSAPNGFCTADCTVNPSACGPFGGTCVAIDVSAQNAVTRAYCFESCAIGAPVGGVVKCHNRPEIACEPVNQAETLFSCIPICQTDADCGTRQCDAASGLCVDAPATGKPIGAACTAVRGTANVECSGGLCLPISSIPDSGISAPGVCSALCRLGSATACGFRSTPLDAGGPPVGACLLPWGDTGYDIGDLGLCLQLCDAPRDCSFTSSSWTCRTDLITTGYGHAVCLTP